MKIDFTEEEMELLVAMLGLAMEAINETREEEKNKEFKKIGMTAAGVSLKVLSAYHELKLKGDEVMDAEIL